MSLPSLSAEGVRRSSTTLFPGSRKACISCPRLVPSGSGPLRAPTKNDPTSKNFEPAPAGVGQIAGIPTLLLTVEASREFAP